MKLSEGGIPVCKYCGFADTQAVPRQCCAAGSDYDALAARLAEAEAMLQLIAGHRQAVAFFAPQLAGVVAALDRIDAHLAREAKP